jgi:hypothetical protein
MASASAPRHPTPRHPRRTDAVPTPFNVALDPPMRFMQKLSSRPAWFMAEGALDRLPPGTALARRYIEDVDPNSLGLPENIKNTMAPGVWFPAGTVRRAHQGERRVMA